MSLRCPGCKTAISSMQMLWYLRVDSFLCRGCSRLLALDRTGRRWLAAPPLVGLGVGYALARWLDATWVLSVLFLAGISIGIRAGWSRGRLRIRE